ncbi:hypothetical protein FCH28_09615 [Streptomyces piniterrae]|uniref:Uncharacterized protein n=1 Tax=Streptomyces piniterrae TaxID=2571125 RepID=A0A4V5ML28_9ACTN|nr:hypothetical protein [Streptomyces piniterrae]TJZ55588.1 hypothetical protein FCH28_09615 [Streptomyces piniterrae]
MTGRAATDGTTRCPGCRAPIIRQLVGQRAALNVTADLQPLTPTEQAAARTPNRLIWCLYRLGPHAPARLRWIDQHHPARCPHEHVAEHACTGPRPAPAQPAETLF